MFLNVFPVVLHVVFPCCVPLLCSLCVRFVFFLCPCFSCCVPFVLRFVCCVQCVCFASSLFPVDSLCVNVRVPIVFSVVLYVCSLWLPCLFHVCSCVFLMCAPRCAHCSVPAVFLVYFVLCSYVCSFGVPLCVPFLC